MTRYDELNAARDERIFEAARSVAQAHGLAAVGRDRVARESGLSAGSVSNFGRTRVLNGQNDHDPRPFNERIMNALMDWAVTNGDAEMLRSGLARGCVAWNAIPAYLRERVLK